MRLVAVVAALDLVRRNCKWVKQEEIEAITTFCLIHGSGQGPEGWKLLVHELEQKGHSVLTPAFHLDRTDERAAWHADTLVEALKSSGHEPADVVCVAHSANGMYLPLVAERWLPRRMIFLAALVPRPGISIIEQHQADPLMFNPAWVGQMRWTMTSRGSGCFTTVHRIASHG